jgi:hypothetical protein
MKRIALPILLASTMLAQVASAQTSSSTPVIGYYKFDVKAGNSAWVSGFVSKKDFQGAATSMTAGATSVINQTGASFGSFALHYVEILSGPKTGLILDIVSNTGNSITVDGNTASLGLTGTETYAVRKHATFKTLFPVGSGLAEFEDSITLENSDGTQTVAYFDGVNWVDQLSAELADDTIVYPGQGVMITALADRVVTFGGNEVSYVKTGPTIVPVYALANNFVGVINPLVNTAPSATATDFTTLGNYGLSNETTGIEPFADSVAVFSTDGLFNTVNVYYSDGVNVINSVSSAIGDSDAVRNGSAIQIQPLEDNLVTLPQSFTSN